jgi:hypothetical protein
LKNAHPFVRKLLDVIELNQISKRVLISGGGPNNGIVWNREETESGRDFAYSKTGCRKKKSAKNRKQGRSSSYLGCLKSTLDR